MRNIAIISEGIGGIYTIPNVNGGAVETWITDLILQNEKFCNCHFDVFTCYDKKAKEYKFKNTKIFYFKVNRLEKFIAKAYCYIRRRITSNNAGINPYDVKVAWHGKWDKYDYILVENGMGVYEEIIKKKNTQGKMIYHMRNDVEYVSQVPWAERSDIRTKIVGKTAIEVLCISKYILKRFISVQPTKHIRLFYNCVDTERFKPFDRDMTQIVRKKYGVKNTDVVFLYSGRVMPEKGVLELVRAFSKMMNKCPNAKLIIAGLINPPEYENKIRHYEKKANGKIEILGWMPPYDMQYVYAAGDVVVAPSITEEPFGMITIESMAMEKPIIVSDSGGMPEIVKEDCGIIVHRGENLVNEISDAMTFLYNNPDKRIEMGKRGREIVMNTYDFRKEFLHERMMKLFEELDER